LPRKAEAPFPRLKLRPLPQPLPLPQRAGMADRLMLLRLKLRSLPEQLALLYLRKAARSLLKKPLRPQAAAGQAAAPCPLPTALRSLR
jgi:hypothetical protein